MKCLGHDPELGLEPRPPDLESRPGLFKAGLR